MHEVNTRAQKLLDRKAALGRRASYRRLGKMIGTSHVAVLRVLTGEEMAVPVDRPAMLDKIERALFEIESELETAE